MTGTPHVYHQTAPLDDGREAILHDNCLRCAEHAADPFLHSDPQRLGVLGALHQRWVDGGKPGPGTGYYTDTEIVALRNIDDVMHKATRMVMARMGVGPLGVIG